MFTTISDVPLEQKAQGQTYIANIITNKYFMYYKTLLLFYSWIYYSSCFLLYMQVDHLNLWWTYLGLHMTQFQSSDIHTHPSSHWTLGTQQGCIYECWQHSTITWPCFMNSFAKAPIYFHFSAKLHLLWTIGSLNDLSSSFISTAFTWQPLPKRLWNWVSHITDLFYNYHELQP